MMIRLSILEQVEGSGQIKRVILSHTKPASVVLRVVIHLGKAAFASLSTGIVGKKGTLLMHAGV